MVQLLDQIVVSVRPILPRRPEQQDILTSVQHS